MAWENDPNIKNLKINMDVSIGDVDFLTNIKRLDVRVISRDDQVREEFIDKLKWYG